MKPFKIFFSKIKQITAICILLFYFTFNAAESSKPEWKYYYEGKDVKSVTQDGNSFWIYYKGYDSDSLTVKINPETQSILNYINFKADKIQKDSQGNFWAIGNGGLLKFNDDSLIIWEKFKLGNDLSFKYFSDMVIDSSGNVWLFYPGFGILKFNEISLTHYYSQNAGLPLHSNGQEALEGYLVCDKKNNIWVVYKDEGAAVFDGNTWKILNETNSGLPNEKFRGIALDKTGSIWISASEVLIKYDGNEWKYFYKENTGLQSSLIYKIAFDSKNNLWGATGGSNGIVKFDGNDFTVYNTLNSGLSNNRINYIYIDSLDNIWISVGENITNFKMNIFNENGIVFVSVDNFNIASPVGLIYPNPANNVVNLKITPQVSGFYTIKLFDILGIEILNIYEGYISDGFEKIFPLHVASLSAGSYYYVISNDRYTVRGNLLIVR